MARSIQLKIMLTEKERRELEGAADEMGETISVFVRRAVREQMRRDTYRNGRPK